MLELFVAALIVLVILIASQVAQDVVLIAWSLLKGRRDKDNE